MKRVIDKGKYLMGLQHNPSTAVATLADSLSLCLSLCLSLSLCLQPPNKRLNNKEQIELLLLLLHRQQQGQTQNSSRLPLPRPLHFPFSAHLSFAVAQVAIADACLLQLPGKPPSPLPLKYTLECVIICFYASTTQPIPQSDAFSAGLQGGWSVAKV